MAITFSGTGGYYTRIGRFGKVVNDVISTISTFNTDMSSLIAQYVGSPEIYNGVQGIFDSSKTGLSNLPVQLSNYAAQTVLEMVFLDKPGESYSLQEALIEANRQAIAGSVTVQKCTAASSVAVLSNNYGNGVGAVTIKRTDGIDGELIYPEVSFIKCISDSQTGGTALGKEVFQYFGSIAPPRGPFSEDYPKGFGSQTRIQCSSANYNQSTTTNLLRNSNFENWTSTALDYWTAETGAYGTDIVKESSVVYMGTNAIEFPDGGGDFAISQTFDSSTGSTQYLQPYTQYAVNLYAYVDVQPAAGEIAIELTDASGTVIQDESGNDCSTIIDLTVLTAATWTSATAFFRTPYALPETCQIRIRRETGISAGTVTYIDQLSMVPATQLYPGGPYMAIFQGSDRWSREDGWTLTCTNNFGGSSNQATFQFLFDRLFGIRLFDLQLNSASSPTIADSLITS